MILDRLVLHNFKRFRDAEIDFHDGITGILGNNGTGKSSLVTAVFFALFGVKATGISADYIVSSFASPKEKCEIALDFRIGGDTYKVIRTFRKGKSVTHEAELYKNKQLLAKEVSPVEEAVKQVIGMGPVDFRNTIYAAQKDLLTLLENTPGKRKEWFLRALGIDYLNTESQKVLKGEIDEKTSALQRKEGELAAVEGTRSETDLAALEQSVAASKAAIGEHTKKNLALRAQRAELDGKLKILAGKKTAYEILLRRQQDIEKEIQADTTQVKKLEAFLAAVAGEEAEYRKIEGQAASFEAVRARLDAIRKQQAEHQRITQEIGFAEKEIADLAARAGKQESRIAALQKDAEESAKLLQAVRAGIGAGADVPDDRLEAAVSYRLAEILRKTGTLAAQVQRYTEEREKIARDRETIRTAGPDGTCPLCRQKLGTHYLSLEAEFGAKLAELAEKAVAEQGKLEQLGSEKERVEALKPSLDAARTLAAGRKLKDGYEADLTEIRGKKEKREKDRETLLASRVALGFDEAACKACEQEAENARKLEARFTALGKKIGQAATTRQQIADLTAKIADRNTALAGLKQEIAASAYDPGESHRIEAELAATDTGLRAQEVAIANAERDKKFAEEKIAEYRKAGERIESLKAEVRAMGDEIELLKMTRTMIAGYVVYLMQVVRSRIEGEVSRILAEITGGRYEQVLLDEDFNLLVRDIDADYPVDRFSGGEQDDIAVALRIALSRYLAELHNIHESTFLIFDEIFGSQDEERRNNLLTALRTQESRFPQILLISHIEEIQGEFATTLKVEPSADGASRIREVA